MGTKRKAPKSRAKLPASVSEVLKSSLLAFEKKAELMTPEVVKLAREQGVDLPTTYRVSAASLIRDFLGWSENEKLFRRRFNTKPESGLLDIDPDCDHLTADSDEIKELRAWWAEWLYETARPDIAYAR